MSSLRILVMALVLLYPAVSHAAVSDADALWLLLGFVGLPLLCVVLLITGFVLLMIREERGGNRPAEAAADRTKKSSQARK